MLKKVFKKDIARILYAFVFIFIILIVAINYSSSILKEEIISKQLKISELNSEFLSEDLNHNITNIELFIDNITSYINLKNNDYINNELFDILSKFPQIRSVNIVKEQEIIYSSNKENIGFDIKGYDFIPKPLFNNNILRVSSTKIGRDISSNINDKSFYNDNHDMFIPIIKDIRIDGEKVSFLVNLNTNYYINKFNILNKEKKLTIELLRIDKLLLLSTNKEEILGRKKSNYLLERLLQTNTLSSIYTIDNNKFITAYSLTKDYPFIIGIHLDYEESLLAWNEKSYKFFLISSIIIFICMSVVLLFILLFKKGKENEINLQKLQIKEHKKFKYLFQDSHLLTAILSKDGEILDINNSALDFLGLKKDDIKDTFLWDLECWQKRNKNYIEELFTENNDFAEIRKEIVVFDKEGNNAFIDFNMHVIKNSDENTFIIIAQNITDRKKRERCLKQAYSVFNNTRDGIIITDKNTNIVDVNSSFEFITGYKKEEILNKKVNILKSNVQDKEFYKNMWKSINTKGFWKGEITNLKINKELFTEWITINAIYDENKKVINYIGIFSDITEEKNKELLLKAQELQLFQQSKLAAMGEMIENIAHQWRQPLSVISTAATGIRIQKEFGTLTDTEEEKSLRAINESSQYLSQTIDDFRNYLKTDKSLVLFDLEENIERAMTLLSSKFKNKNISIIQDIEKISIFGLSNEFTHVIMNILTNAKDALEDNNPINKYIFISAFETNEFSIIRIKDNAGGIKDNIIKKVFEPYFTTRHQSRGTGIGLYMSEEIISNHMHGSLTVNNEHFEYDNKEYFGACFEIKIPKQV